MNRELLIEMGYMAISVVIVTGIVLGIMLFFFWCIYAIGFSLLQDADEKLIATTAVLLSSAIITVGVFLFYRNKSNQ